jgi:membrane-associated phospholipid phosphatase
MQIQMLLWIQQFQSSVLDSFFIAVTLLGEELFYVAILGFVYWCIDKQAARRLVLILGLSTVTNSALKEIVNAPRPIGVEGIRSLRTETAQGASFPSGHTQTATAFFVGLSVALKRPMMWVLSAVVILLVGLSRLYLGVHWPVDVLGAIVVGLIVVAIGSKLDAYANYERTLLPHLILLIIVVLSLFFFQTTSYLKSAGVLIGFLVGYFLEEAFVQFDVRATAAIQFFKYVLGMAATLGVHLGLAYLLPEEGLWLTIQYTLTIAFIMAGVPKLFLILGWSRRRIF